MLPNSKCHYLPFIAIIFFSLQLLVTSSLLAQKGPGFSALRKGDIEEAAIFFQKDVKSKKTKIEGLLGMAQVTSAAANNDRDLLKAYDYIKECSQLYRQLKSKKKKKYKTEFKISSKIISTTKQSIFNEILENAKDKADISYYDAILKKSLTTKEKYQSI